LKRGVIHCSRCGSRVVSNIDYCPFCGHSLRPVYARLWFWLIVVVVVAAGVVALINVSLPKESPAPSSPAEPAKPQVIGAAADSSLKDLSIGTGIDNSGLKVMVNSVTAGPTASNGAQIYIVDVEFTNQTENTITLYSTQWMLEISDGTRLDTFVGPASDGTTISSNFENYDLAPQGLFSGRLYFAVAAPVASDEDIANGVEPTPLTPSSVVYQPTALAYSEDLLVTWKVPAADIQS